MVFETKLPRISLTRFSEYINIKYVPKNDDYVESIRKVKAKDGEMYAFKYNDRLEGPLRLSVKTSQYKRDGVSKGIFHAQLIALDSEGGRFDGGCYTVDPDET